MLSSATFFILSKTTTSEQFFSYGWRIPFIASALLVWIGLYIRLKITETPEFKNAAQKKRLEKVPVVAVFAKHTKAIVLGTIATITTFLLFYIMTVFSLSWGTTALHYAKNDFLIAQMISMLFFALGVPVSAVLADRNGRNNILIASSAGILLFGLSLGHFFVGDSFLTLILFLSTGLLLMGFTYGPIGTALAEIFPPGVRYTGASLCFTLAGIFGASLTPFLATTLATKYGLQYVGYYLSAGAALSIAALLLSRSLMRSTEN